jgi:ribokinase
LTRAATPGRVVVVGSANTDHVARVARLPAVGETIVADGYLTAPGGKGLNQAVAAARQGASVALIACVGTDEAGDELVRLLAAEGIDPVGLRRTSGAPTGLAMVTVAEGGANTVVVAPLANSRLSPEDIDTDGAGAVIETASALLVQLEVQPPVVERALRLAQAAGVMTVLNPAPAPGRVGEGLAGVDLRLIDVLVPNETEATTLTGLPAEEAGPALVAAGCSAVVVTMGAKGALVATVGAAAPVHVPAFAVTSVDATAAGDAFCGALAAGLAAGQSLTVALRRASAAGALATTVLGAVPSLPSAAAVDRLLASPS